MLKLNLLIFCKYLISTKNRCIELEHNLKNYIPKPTLTNTSQLMVQAYSTDSKVCDEYCMTTIGTILYKITDIGVRLTGDCNNLQTTQRCHTTLFHFFDLSTKLPSL